MRLAALVLGLICFSATIGAQSANVIELSIPDSERARQAFEKRSKAYEAAFEADDEWLKVRDDIERHYLKARPGDTKAEGCPDMYLTANWACRGFTFSEDFRYITPLPEPPVDGLIGHGPIYRQGLAIDPVDEFEVAQ